MGVPPPPREPTDQSQHTDATCAVVTVTLALVSTAPTGAAQAEQTVWTLRVRCNIPWSAMTDGGLLSAVKVVRNSFPFSITTELYERFTRL